MRIEQLTFTRFLAAIPIIIFHFGRDTFFFTNESFSFLAQNSYLGVSYFFVLSGFVMILAYGNRDQVEGREFLSKRIIRIYPAYILALLLLYSYMIHNQTMSDYRGMALNAAVVQAYIPGHALDFNYPAWSISVEFFFYLIFPWLFNKIYTKFDTKKLLWSVLIIWILSQLASTILANSGFYHGFPSKTHDLIYYFPFMHLNQFLLGNLAGLYFMERLRDRKGNFDLHIVILLILLIVFIKYHSLLNLHNGLLGILFVPLMLLISVNTGFITKLFATKPLVYLGEISYGIYIFQLPVYYYVMEWLEKLKWGDMSARFFLYCGALIIISALSYTFIESPLRNMLKKKIQAKA